MNTTASSHENQSANEKHAESSLECNICFEDSTEPVTTTCGHIYCWSCIYKWMHSKAENNYCPVCKNVISEEKIIPLYTKNNTHSKRKADENIPKRPQQEREERKENDPNRPQNNWFNFMSNPVFNAFFAGINIRSPNMAINIGFPTLIPMLIIYLFNFLSSFLTSDPTQSFNQNQHQSQSQSQRNTGGTNYSGRGGNSHTYNSRASASASTAAMVEDDYSMPKFILMLLLCIGLPMLVRRIMRS